MRRRAYRATAVKNLKIENVLAQLAEGPIWVGLDVGNGEVFAVVRDRPGHAARPWKTKQPSEIGGLITVLSGLAAARPLVVAMESSGTYGDALRQAATDAQLDAHRVHHAPLAEQLHDAIGEGLVSTSQQVEETQLQKQEDLGRRAAREGSDVTSDTFSGFVGSRHCRRKAVRRRKQVSAGRELRRLTGFTGRNA